MFGYVTIDKPELKVKEFYRYKSYYCGLCRTLKEEYGFRGRMTLSYDMAFLVLFLTSLYETPTKELQSHCPLHPVKKIPMLQNEISEYGAKMNILLVYFKCEDDWKDDKSLQGAAGMRLFRKKAETICREDKSLKGIAGMHLFRKKAKELCKEYKRQAQVIQKQLKVLAVYEEKQEETLDLAAGAFGKLMAELFVYKEDMWEQELRNFGFYLGKFIYIMDAYDDLEEDLKTGSYNPLKAVKKNSKDDNDYENTVQQILVMMMAEATAAFEKLPLLWDSEILRNILYSGVWAKYNKKEKQEKQERDGK